jgi:hypothetical protein
MFDTYQVRMTQALWYAWGHADAGVKLAGDAFAFAEAYAKLYAEYDARQSFMMPSMQDAFAIWQAGNDVVTGLR